VNLVYEENCDDFIHLNQTIYDEEGDIEHVGIEPKGGESLVIQRALIGPRVDSNKDWLRPNIFKT
jgi:hypothetical protein